MTEYRVGQRVHVEFDGEVTSIRHDEYYGHDVNVRRADGFTHTMRPEDITRAEPLDPENWPPQVGDIWEADGHEFVGFVPAYNCDVALISVDSPATASIAQDYFDYFKKLNPRLVRRRGQ